MDSGRRIGRYRLVRQIGKGGIGSVFKAISEPDGLQVAIKVMHPKWTADPRVVESFLKEERLAKVLRHPSFVEIFDCGQLPNGETFLVMEMLKGERLSCRLRRFPQGAPIGWVLELARQIANAMTIAHDCAIFHCDLKPANLMLIADPKRPGVERVKILDLGFAKIGGSLQFAASDTDMSVESGFVMGTPGYMAPEQCVGSSQIDGQTDVYSLGIILYEALSGRRPFEARSVADLMNQHVRSSPMALRQLRFEIPTTVAQLVEQQLSKRATERPTMRALAAAATAAIHQYSQKQSPPFFCVLKAA